MDISFYPPGMETTQDELAPHTGDYLTEAFGDTAIPDDWGYEDEPDMDAYIAERELIVEEVLTAADMEPPF